MILHILLLQLCISYTHSKFHGFAFSYNISSSGATKTHFPDILGLYTQTRSLTDFVEECNPRFPIFKHEAAGFYLFVNCDENWVINPTVHPYNALISAEKKSFNPSKIGWRFLEGEVWKYDTTLNVQATEPEKTVFNTTRPTGCPLYWSPFKSCSQADEGLHCPYGFDICHGETYPSQVMFCESGRWRTEFKSCSQ